MVFGYLSAWKTRPDLLAFATQHRDDQLRGQQHTFQVSQCHRRAALGWQEGFAYFKLVLPFVLNVYFVGGSFMNIADYLPFGNPVCATFMRQ